MTPEDPRTAPWSISPEDFPWDEPLARQMVFLLRYAVLAPSSNNTQPWQFSVTEEEIRVFPDKSRWLMVGDPDQRELYLSIGCALENLLIAAENFGFAPNVHYYEGAPDEPVVRVALARGGIPSPLRTHELFRAIPRRQTNHGVYDGKPVAPEALDRIVQSGVEDGVRLWLTGVAEDKREFHELLVRADAIQFANPAFREELGHWLGEGAFGTPWLLAKIGELAVTHVNAVGRASSRHDARVLMSSPILGILSTRGKDRVAQVRAGQALERIYLMATHLGLAIQPVSQILEVPETRVALHQGLPQGAGVAQQPFRLGHAERQKGHTPRRPVESMLI